MYVCIYICNPGHRVSRPRVYIYIYIYIYPNILLHAACSTCWRVTPLPVCAHIFACVCVCVCVCIIGGTHTYAHEYTNKRPELSDQ